jgi:undecaprenyl diphosphate synthase
MVSSQLLPKHIGIIVDGNRRWAKENNLPALEGHRRGFVALKKIIKKSQKLGIKIITIWGFSTENWNRSKEEVGYLMNFFEKMLTDYLKEALKNNVRIIHLGRKDRLNKNLINKISEVEEKTKLFNKYYLCIALDYGGQDEILRAINKIYNLQFSIYKITRENFNQFLDTKDLPYPNPDLIIRTSGEVRTSGFLIWQAAYSEYIFTKKYFPDFTENDFEECINEYLRRQRRFGK